MVSIRFNRIPHTERLTTSFQKTKLKIGKHLESSVDTKWNFTGYNYREQIITNFLAILLIVGLILLGNIVTLAWV